MTIFERWFGGGASRDIFDSKNGHLKNFGEWVGNMKFTEEEIAELDAEVAKGIRQFAVDTLDESTDRSRTRRKFAVLSIQSYILFLFMSGMLYKFDSDWALYWLRLATDTQLGWLVTGAGAFFWGVHILRAKQRGDKK